VGLCAILVSQQTFVLVVWALESTCTNRKGQEVMVILAPLGPVEELPIICGLCGTLYSDDDCPTRETEREDATRVIQERLRRDREETDALVRDVEEWLGEHCGKHEKQDALE
jgi:hypothetical protein